MDVRRPECPLFQSALVCLTATHSYGRHAGHAGWACRQPVQGDRSLGCRSSCARVGERCVHGVPCVATSRELVDDRTAATRRIAFVVVCLGEVNALSPSDAGSVSRERSDSGTRTPRSRSSSPGWAATSYEEGRRLDQGTRLRLRVRRRCRRSAPYRGGLAVSGHGAALADGRAIHAGFEALARIVRYLGNTPANRTRGAARRW